MAKVIVGEKIVESSKKPHWGVLFLLGAAAFVIVIITTGSVIGSIFMGFTAFGLFIGGLASFLYETVEYCKPCDDVFDDGVEKCPTCQAKLETVALHSSDAPECIRIASEKTAILRMIDRAVKQPRDRDED